MSAPTLSRRQVLAGSAAAAALALFEAIPALAQDGTRRYSLTAKAGRALLRGKGRTATAIWGYDGSTPGPVLRVKQGETLEVVFKNQLKDDMTIHWHGMRLPNAMDGVPHLTQKPVKRGQSFTYRFPVPDAGTYLYHPHGKTSEQLGRGLYGALIVEERNPPQADRDLVRVLTDWKLATDGRIDGNFDDAQARSHEGRIGNVVTINGGPATTESVRGGERLRLRLVNVANARIFHLGFEAIDALLIALDGQPVTPRRLGKERLAIGPGMRADFMIDAPAEPGKEFTLVDHNPAKDPVDLLKFAADGQAPLRREPLPAPARLAENPIPRPARAGAQRHEIAFAGGAAPGHHGPNMGAPPPRNRRAARRKPDPQPVWTLNGQAMMKHAAGPGGMKPLLTLKLGQSHILTFKNNTMFDHPMHLHGYVFDVLSRNGKPLPEPLLTDTILMSQQETVEIAFIADNPGDWMIHCHILEHADAGMGAVIRVA